MGNLFINFLLTKEDSFFNKIIHDIEIINTNDEFELKKIFEKYQTIYKIDGIDYAYFTKLFFFFSLNNSLPILDNWLTKSFIFLTINDSNLNENEKKEITKPIFEKNPFEENNSSFRIKQVKKRPEFYFRYVLYLSKKSKELDVSISELETFLFGWDLTQKEIIKEYTNPRIIYKQFFKEYFK